MWEDPFHVTHMALPGSVRISSEDGISEPSASNIEHLRKFYPNKDNQVQLQMAARVA